MGKEIFFSAALKNIYYKFLHHRLEISRLLEKLPLECSQQQILQRQNSGIPYYLKKFRGGVMDMTHRCIILHFWLPE